MQDTVGQISIRSALEKVYFNKLTTYYRKIGFYHNFEPVNFAYFLTENIINLQN